MAKERASLFGFSPMVSQESTSRTPEEKPFDAPQDLNEAKELHESRQRDHQWFEPTLGPRPLRVKKTPDLLEKTLSEPLSLTNLLLPLRAIKHDSEPHVADAHTMEVGAVRRGDALPHSTDARPAEQETREETGLPVQLRLGKRTLQHAQHGTSVAPNQLPRSQHESNVHEGREETNFALSEARTIRVTIGRVDVRAILPSRDTAARSNNVGRPSAVPLDEYLKQRKAGQR